MFSHNEGLWFSEPHFSVNKPIREDFIWVQNVRGSQVLRNQMNSLIKRCMPHPSRVAVGGCDNQTVLICGLSVQRVSQKQKTNPIEKGQRRNTYHYYTHQTNTIQDIVYLSPHISCLSHMKKEHSFKGISFPINVEILDRWCNRVWGRGLHFRLYLLPDKMDVQNMVADRGGWFLVKEQVGF